MYNVMKEAHKKARNLIKVRPMPYRCALGAALVACHAQFKLLTKLKRSGYVSRDTTQLKDGDVIRLYGCLLVLKNKRVCTSHDEADGVVVFDTTCLVREADSAIPAHWLNREGGYTIQGNQRATWALIPE